MTISSLDALQASHHTYLGNESVFKLSLQGGGDLPFHKFTARARVLLTQKGSSKSESPLRGTVKDVCDEYLNIAVSFNVSIDTIQILCQKVIKKRLKGVLSSRKVFLPFTKICTSLILVYFSDIQM